MRPDCELATLRSVWGTLGSRPLVPWGAAEQHVKEQGSSRAAALVVEEPDDQARDWYGVREWAVRGKYLVLERCEE